MLPDDHIELLLAEHAAATECGLLRDGLNERETALAAKLLAHGSERPATYRFDASTLRRPMIYRLPYWVAAAAAILLAVGLWTFMGGLPQVGFHPTELADGSTTTPSELLNGRMRIVPVLPGTRYKVADAKTGKIELLEGEVYVELQGDEGLEAEVQTAAGTATALGTQFYVHYARRGTISAGAILAVAVVGGLVEVTNPHGRIVGAAGEVLIADKDTAPAPQADLTPPPLLREGDWRSFGKTIGLLHYPEVQAELNLSEAQKARLSEQRPEDKAILNKLFKELHDVPRAQWAVKSAEFRDMLLAKIRDVLTAEQQWRFWQITVQLEGFFALARDEVADSLELTAQQRQQIEVAVDEYQQARQQLRKQRDKDKKDKDKKDKDKNKDEYNKRRAQLWGEANEVLESFLTSTQRQMWTTLVGNEFTLTERKCGPWSEAGWRPEK